MLKNIQSRVLTAAKVKCFLVTNLINIRYITGLELSYGLVLITAKKVKLYVDGRYKETAEKKVKKGISVKDMESFIRDLRRKKICAFEAATVTVEQMNRWKKTLKNTKFVQSKEIIEEIRRVKTPEEIKKFKKAQSITRQVIKKIPKMLKEGITERQLALKLLAEVIKLGADGLSFEPIVAFGKNTSQPHHHPGDSKFIKGQLVQIDMGAKYKGYCADQSEIFFTGKPTELQSRVYNAVKKAQKAALAKVRPGIANHELDKIAREILEKEKLNKYFVHSLGHGLGLEIHEGVTLSQKGKKTKLLENEIITIEPGVYIPGKFGIRLETEVIVKKV